MDIINKAKELGYMIGESQQMLRLQNAEAAMESDEKAKQLMREYKQVQIALVRATKEKQELETIEELRQKLMGKQEEINSYSITNEYLEAKSNFDSFMKTINDVIIFSITGEEPCSPNKCGSCGGGCGK